MREFDFSRTSVKGQHRCPKVSSARNIMWSKRAKARKCGLLILLPLKDLSKECQKSYNRDNWLVAVSTL